MDPIVNTIAPLKLRPHIHQRRHTEYQRSSPDSAPRALRPRFHATALGFGLKCFLLTGWSRPEGGTKANFLVSKRKPLQLPSKGLQLIN